MTVTYDITNNTGKVRLAIADIDTTTSTGLRSTWTVLFTDEEIGVFLTQASSSVWMAAAYALRSIAASRALTAKMRKLGDFMEDLTKIAEALRSQADAYEDMAKNEPAGAIAEVAQTDFAYRDIIQNYYLRSG